MTATLNYRYTHIGGTMVVYEYEGGRRGHSYMGRHEGQYGVTLYPRKGGFSAESNVPYVQKAINVFMLEPLHGFDDAKGEEE